MLGECVDSMDVSSRTLRTVSGKSIIGSEALLLAIGAPPMYIAKLSGLDSIRYLREREQARKLFDVLLADKEDDDL